MAEACSGQAKAQCFCAIRGSARATPAIWRKLCWRMLSLKGLIMSDRWFLVSGSCVQRLQAPTMCLLVLWRWVQLLQHPIGQALTRLRSFLSQQPARTRATKQLRGILHTTRMMWPGGASSKFAGNQGKCKVSEVHLCGHRQLEQNFGHPQARFEPTFWNFAPTLSDIDIIWYHIPLFWLPPFGKRITSLLFWTSFTPSLLGAAGSFLRRTQIYGQDASILGWTCGNLIAPAGSAAVPWWRLPTLV